MHVPTEIPWWRWFLLPLPILAGGIVLTYSLLAKNLGVLRILVAGPLAFSLTFEALILVGLYVLPNRWRTLGTLVYASALVGVWYYVISAVGGLNAMVH